MLPIDKSPLAPCVGGKLIRKNHKCIKPNIHINAIESGDRYHCDCGDVWVYQIQWVAKDGKYEGILDWYLIMR